MRKEILTSANINYEKGLCKCMGKVQLYERMLDAFINDKDFFYAKSSLAAGEYDKMSEYIRNVKENSRNLEITKVFEASAEIHQKLRDKDYNGITALFDTLEEAYNLAVSAITSSI